MTTNTARYSIHLKQAEEHIIQSVVLESVKNESDNSDNVSKELISEHLTIP